MKTKFDDYKDETITLYHGTITNRVEEIQQNGLTNTTGYVANWFMFSTDFESALYHSTPLNNGNAYVFEFKIPYNDSTHWKGYPYLWEEYKRNEKSSWFAPMKQIPKEFITKLHEVSYDKYLKQKHDSF